MASEDASYKRLYFERDSEEIENFVQRHGDAYMGDIYLKMLISQRSKVRGDSRIG